jgi:xanthine dehydrogenase accessory factor
MLILADGRYCGLLSGGCLESDLTIHAQEVLESGVARAVEYDMRGPDDILFGIGAGCEGAMRVLLEPAGPGTPAAAALTSAGRTLRAGRASALIAVHDSTHLALGTRDAALMAASSAALANAADGVLAEAASRAVNIEEARAFVQFLAPAPHILICGAGPDAQPVVAAAQGLGWRVSVVDHRPAYATADRFPGADVYRADARELRATLPLKDCHAVVVMSHHLASDTAYLRELAEAGVPDYVGLLGPQARRRRIAEELGDRAHSLIERLRGPVGINIGAVTPEGIALSIIAEIHAWLAGR